MTTSKTSLLTATIALSSMIAACGGGSGGGSSNSPPPPDASPGGIWVGTSSASGANVIGLVAEGGEFHFIQTDGVQYFGKVDVNVTSVSASFSGVTEFGTTFVDGTTSGNGTLSGDLSERKSISGTTDFTTAGGSRATGQLSLTYNPLYDRDSSLTTIAGNYSDPSGNVISIDSNGAIFSQDPFTGCVVNGTASIIDSRYNAYRAEYTYSSCTGAEAVLNGLTFRGLGTLDNTESPERIIAGVTAGSGTNQIAIVWLLERL